MTNAQKRGLRTRRAPGYLYSHLQSQGHRTRRRRCLAASAGGAADLKLENDEQFGVTIVRRACEEPVRQIVQNCGVEGAVVVEKIRNQQDPNLGFNAFTEQYEDLVKGGVIDPTKVTRTALQNAASIASLMLTTEAMICGVVEESGE